jgi:polysaccharide biosynthesis protein PslF
MKVLVISAAFPPMKAPEGDHMFHLCRHLAERGLNVQVLTTKGNGVATGLQFKVHPIMRNWSWQDLPRFLRFLKNSRPDGILLFYFRLLYNDHPMITFAPTFSKALVPSATFVTQFSNSERIDPKKLPFWERGIRKVIKIWAGATDSDYSWGTLLRDSDRIVVLSERDLAVFTNGRPSINGKYSLVPPPPILYMTTGQDGTARERGRKALGVKANDFVIMNFGYVRPGKDIETILRAFRLVTGKRKNLRLAIVGGNTAFARDREYRKELQQLSEQLGIKDRVRWTGDFAWDSDEASLYLRAADLCVLPFVSGIYLAHSSFGAAAAHGLPIITTQPEVLESPLVDRENLFLCPPKKPEILADAIETLINNPDLRQRISAGALRLAEDRFSWEKATDRILKALEKPNRATNLVQPDQGLTSRV